MFKKEALAWITLDYSPIRLACARLCGVKVCPRRVTRRTNDTNVPSSLLQLSYLGPFFNCGTVPELHRTLEALLSFHLVVCEPS